MRAAVLLTAFLSAGNPGRRARSPRRSWAVIAQLLSGLVGGQLLAANAAAISLIPLPETAAIQLRQLGGVRTLAQDSTGFIWLGGATGVARFNGRELLLFPDEPAPLAILGDAQHGVWTAGQAGVYRFTAAGGFVRVSDVPARALAAGAAGVVAGTDQGLLVLDGTGAAVAAAERVGAVRALLVDSKGRLWVAADTGLHVFDGELQPLTHYADSFARVGGRVVAMAEDQLGRLWLASEAGELLRSREGEREFTAFERPVGAVVSMLRDSAGRLWLGTAANGLLEFDPLAETLIHHTSNPFDSEALAANQVQALLRDNTEHLWIATSFGVQRGDLTPQPVVRLPNLAGTRALAGLGDGHLWVGGKRGLTEVDLERRRAQIRFDSARLDGPVTTLESKDQQVLFAAIWERGVLAVDTVSGDLNPLAAGAERTLALSYHPDAGLFALQEDGALLSLQGEHWQPLAAAVEAMAADPAGGLWLLADGGLWYRQTGAASPARVPLPPDFERPQALYVVGEQEIWVGGDYGRALRLDSTGKVLGEQTFALAGGALALLFEDSLGRLWGASSHALAGPGGGGVTLWPGPGSGFGLTDFQNAVAYRDRRGYVYLGGPAGVDVLHPQHLHPEPPPAPVVVDAYRRGSGPWRPAGAQLRIAAHQALALGFAALDYGATPGLTYQLLGYDSEPLLAAGGGRVHYGKLEPGRYELVVNRAGESLAAVRFPVEITAAWWQRLWTYAPVLMPAALALWLLGRRRRAPVRSALLAPADARAELRPAVLALAELADRVSVDNAALPAFRAQAQHVRQLLGAAPAGERSILVVDDDPVNRMVLSSMLSLAGYGVREAGGGFEALELIERDASIALVILDVMMPQISGFETCQRLRLLQRGRDLPVIFLTAQQGDSDRDRSRAAGGDRILYKPVDKTALLSEVAALLQQAPPTLAQ